MSKRRPGLKPLRIESLESRQMLAADGLITFVTFPVTSSAGEVVEIGLDKLTGGLILHGDFTDNGDDGVEPVRVTLDNFAIERTDLATIDIVRGDVAFDSEIDLREDGSADQSGGFGPSWVAPRVERGPRRGRRSPAVVGR